MRIRIEDIPESGLFTESRWKENKLARFQPPHDPVPLELVQPVDISMEINRRPDHVEIKGKINLLGRLNCHRCLESYPWQFDHSFRTILVEDRSLREAEEIELEAADLEYEFFDGELIDLDLLVAEEILLALPFQAICSEDCKGICPRCGANLNHEQCFCETEKRNSPFAKLEALRSQLER